LHVLILWPVELHTAVFIFNLLIAAIRRQRMPVAGIQRRRLPVRAVLWAVVTGFCATSASCALGPHSTQTPTTVWRDNFTTRLAALAVLQSLNAELLSNDSATLTLDRWCEAHRLASPAHIVAERVRNVEKHPTAGQREILGVSATDPVRYRRVRLRCGDRVLSEADNFYVPARLTAQMNQALDTSDIAFGRAVQALNFRRRTLSATLLWSPLPRGWEMGEPVRIESSPTLHVPAEVLQHRAVLTLPDGAPISHVIETYKSEVLAFPEPDIRAGRE
jgi:chorismate-pyruvate lyase